MKKMIYLDNAATTAIKPEVFEAMKPYFEEFFGNPASAYNFAGKIKKAVDSARNEVAEFLGAKSNEIYFTSGGSESDNWALKGTAFAYRGKGNHIITSKIEHRSILSTCEYLDKLGYEITYIDVDENGLIKLDELEKAIKPTTILISIMFANNEIGTIQPIKEIGELAKRYNILFHTDAVQAYGHIPINVDELHIDMLSASGHKINGPKGIGIMYLRNGVEIGSFIHGGAQERSRRAGTHNVPGIVGFAKATELAKNNMKERSEYEENLRDYLIERVLGEIAYVKLNGHETKRLTNNANFSFKFIDGKSLLIMLDEKGICVSSGSACSSNSSDVSHVLRAIKLSDEFLNGSLRLTLSEDTDKNDIDYVVEELKSIISKISNKSIDNIKVQ